MSTDPVKSESIYTVLCILLYSIDKYCHLIDYVYGITLYLPKLQLSSSNHELFTTSYLYTWDEPELL